MSFKIEKGIKPPKGIKRKNYAWYRDMEIGDSVVVDQQNRYQIQSAFTRLGWGFVAEGTEDGNYRVWRVEPTNG